MFELFHNSELYKPYPPAANFMLLRIEGKELTSHDLFDRCIRKGLMIRDCSTFPFLSDHFIRFCFLLPEQNDALAKQLLED